MMRGGNREMRRMLDKMGLEMKDIGNVEEVIIKTESKELYLLKPQVIEMKGKEMYDFSGYRFRNRRERKRCQDL